MRIPGLSFSLKRALGISGLKAKIARKTGIPTTKQGLERKIGGDHHQGGHQKEKISAEINYTQNKARPYPLTR